jgi:hypothetical protein
MPSQPQSSQAPKAVCHGPDVSRVQRPQASVLLAAASTAASAHLRAAARGCRWRGVKGVRRLAHSRAAARGGAACATCGMAGRMAGGAAGLSGTAQPRGSAGSAGATGAAGPGGGAIGGVQLGHQVSPARTADGIVSGTAGGAAGASGAASAGTRAGHGHALIFHR